MRTSDLAFSLLYLLALIIAATQIGMLAEWGSSTVSSHLYPWLVVGAGLVMGGLETLRTLFLEKASDGPSLREVWAKSFAARRMLLLGLFVLYLFLIVPLGFMVATAGFCFLTVICLTPKVNVKTGVIAACLAAGTVAFIHLLLVVYLEAFLP